MKVELVTGKLGESETVESDAVPRTGDVVSVRGDQFRVTSVEWSFLHPDKTQNGAVVYLEGT
jgi:hypothetical protein